MNKDKQEIEAKFYLDHLSALEKRLQAIHAECTQERVLEINLRFDTPDNELSKGHRVLRLRRDNRVRMTYKGPADPDKSIAMRNEIEFEVSDFESGRDFLLALGYEIRVVYEKYRASYTFDQVEVSLDEMPYGNFAEIEGPDEETIRERAGQLGLDWEARCKDSYMALFERVKEKRGLDVNNLSFEEFKGLAFSAEDFGIKTADRI